MKEVYTTTDLEKQLKRQRFKNSVKRKIQEAKDWCNNNKDLIIIIAPIALTSIATTVRVIGKNVNLRKEERIKKLNCYDPTLGHYWKLRRELTTKEWLKVDRLRKEGVPLSEILDNMNVLKN